MMNYKNFHLRSFPRSTHHRSTHHRQSLKSAIKSGVNEIKTRFLLEFSPGCITAEKQAIGIAPQLKEHGQHEDATKRFATSLRGRRNGMNGKSRRASIADYLFVISTSLMLLASVSHRALADGTEELFPPPITVAAGSGIVAAGTGMATQPGTINIDVPGVVQQVLLYWEGQMSTDLVGDNTIVVGGQDVTGTLIGGQTFFFSGAYSSAFRADITGLGLISQGANSLAVSGLDFTRVANGAGILVIFAEDGSPTSNIQVRDGLDLAFCCRFAVGDPRRTTVEQVFNFAAADVDRTATLPMFFSSVEGEISTGDERPTQIVVKVNGTETIFDNILTSNDGDEWDTLNLSIPVPAGASSLSVQAFSVNAADPDNDDFSQDPLPASFAWIAANFSIPPPPSPKAALGDRIWEDLNTNGIQDCEDDNNNDIIGDAGDTGPECDTGVPDVPVKLLAGDCDTSLGKTVMTDLNGFYLFEDLDPGDYCVEFGKPPADFCGTDGFDLGEPQFTTQNAGNNDAVDSDADTGSGVTDPVILSAGETDLTVDAGIVCPAKIGDRVWSDDNENGIQDNGEDGVEGVKVTLFECGDDMVAGTADDVETGQMRNTDTDGMYMFGAEPDFTLDPGKYFVQFMKPDGTQFTLPNVNGDDINSDCLPPDGITACTPLASRGINLDRDCGLIPPPPPECDLDLDKKCRVEPQPTADFDKCKGELQQFTVIWTGGPITVSGLPNDAPGGAVGTNQEVTFFGPFSQNDVVVDITGSVQGQSTFHMSCSDEDFNSPDDCGKLAGDGKDKAGFINAWTLEGFVDAEGTVLDCTVSSSGEFTDNCTFAPPPAPNCDTLGKPTSLTFRYSGGGCGASDNDQGDKDSCSGEIDPSQAVTVVAGKKGLKPDDLYTVVPDLVGPEQEFTLSASKFAGDSEVRITNSGGTEANIFHTSCSQPLAVGDVFGSLTLVGFNGAVGGVDVTYSYTVSNNGDPVGDVLVSDSLLGSIAGPFDLGTGESRSFTKATRIDGTTVNIATASGTLADDSVCSDSDKVVIEEIVPPPPPAECKELKPIDALILEYDASQAGGRSIDSVSWYRDKFDSSDPTNNLIGTTGPVASGEVVTFDGFAAADAKNDVDLLIRFTDQSNATSRFHRSCSDEEMNDISDCGNLLGNGKNNDSGLNTWILRNLAGNGKVLGCP